jgi:glycosyltransferase 2 family protein
MIRLSFLCGLAGIVLATLLVAWHGLGAVLAAFAGAGIGILWASAFHLVPMLINARAWQILIPGRRRPGIAFFTWTVWVREAVNNLLPVARIGGEVVSARLLMKHGVRKGPTVASLVVDMTLCIVAQFFFTLLGLALLVHRTSDLEVIGLVALGLAVTVPLLALLGFVQRSGFFTLLARIFRTLFGTRFDRIVGGAFALDRAVRVVYRRRERALACCLWQFLASIVAAGEVWIALRFLGHPISLVDAVLLEALTQAVASAAFVVPGAIGVQEGGFLVFGSLLGLTPELALALALVRRARDLIVFVPALLAWQLSEGRRWLAAAS